MNKFKMFEEQKEEIQELVKEIVEKKFRPASEILLDDVDLCNLLKISRRTALEYRRKKLIRFYRFDDSAIGKSNSKSKIYYILSEVLEDIKKNGGQHEK